MILTIEEAQAVVWRDNTTDWKYVPNTESIEDEYKDILQMTAIFEHVPSGKFYQFYWDKGTYYNESVDYDNMFGWGEDDVRPTEVHQVEKTVTVWESVPKTENAQ